MPDELDTRIRSLEAERLRPVPPPPPLHAPRSCGQGLGTAVDNVRTVDFRGQRPCGDRTTDQQPERPRLKASDRTSAAFAALRRAGDMYRAANTDGGRH